MSSENKAETTPETEATDTETAATERGDAARSASPDDVQTNVSADERPAATPDAEPGAASEAPSDAPSDAAPEAAASQPDATSLESFDADAVAAERAALDGDAPASAGGETSELEADILELQEKLAAKEDQYLRAVADLQNLRRRADKERKDAETFGGQKLAKDMLTIFDNLSMALAQASDAVRENEVGLMNGLELTKKEVVNVFSKHGIEPIEPSIGDKFDPNLHQAMYEQPTDEVAPGAIANVVTLGFTIGGRLLRPATVGVAKAKTAVGG